jgi:hypothetical protein
MALINKGQIVAFFAFDLGDEIDLEQLSRLTAAVPAPPLSRKKQTPPYLQYTRLPLVLHLGSAPELFSSVGTLQATAFDFGAVSLTYRWTAPADLSLDGLPQLSRTLYEQNLAFQAGAAIEQLLARIKSAIARPRLAGLVEDYYLFVIEELDRACSAEELLTEHRATLAQALRFETAPLSPSQQAEAISQSISYYQNDLVLLDWNAAIIYDRDYEDTLSVLELLNVELLEARYIDARLDTRIGEYSKLIRQRPEWPFPFRTPYKQTIQELAELRIESSLLSERVDNSLKLIGDLYLARLHTAAAQRFYLYEWERIISRKLEIISEFYRLLTDRVRTAQSQALELIIILLILVELVLALFR